MIPGRGPAGGIAAFTDTAGTPRGNVAVQHDPAWFRAAPLAVILVAAAAAAVFGPAWSARMAPLPWLVAIVFVGLPHGAADLAVSWRLRGRPLTLWLFAAYASLMAGVLLAFVLAPRPLLVLFAVLSVWHFGLAHAHGQCPPLAVGWPWPAVAAVARGAGVLGVPLAVWPAATARVVGELVGLVAVGPAPAFAAATVRAAGICLAAAGLGALVFEAVATRHLPGGPRRSADTLVDLLAIGLLGIVADPLFSIGIYFLCWHAWREMRPLAALIAPPAAARPAGGLAAVGSGVAAVHVAALPLLVPTWLALVAGWWFLAPEQSPRMLAVMSLVVYLVVTPSHEALAEFLTAAPPVTTAAPLVPTRARPRCRLAVTPPAGRG